MWTICRGDGYAHVGVSARKCSYGGNHPALGVRAELRDVCVEGEYQVCS